MAGERKGHRDLVAAMREHVAIETPAPLRTVVEDGGTDLALARAAASTERGRPLRPHEERQLRRETLEAQRSGASGTQQATRKPSLRDRLERMSEQQRLDALATITPGSREYAYVSHLIDSIAYEEAEAEYLAAVGDEESSVAAIDTAAESEAWTAEQDAASEERREAMLANRLRDEGDVLSEAERRAEEDLAAATAGPVYVGDPADLFDDDEEEGAE